MDSRWAAVRAYPGVEQVAGGDTRWKVTLPAASRNGATFLPLLGPGRQAHAQ